MKSNTGSVNYVQGYLSQDAAVPRSRDGHGNEDSTWNPRDRLSTGKYICLANSSFQAWQAIVAFSEGGDALWDHL